MFFFSQEFFVIVFIFAGICVRCDAGMCSHFFHSTCAHKYGLINSNNEDYYKFVYLYYFRVYNEYKFYFEV